MTIVELLLVLTLSTSVLGATLSIFTQFERDNRTNQLQNESQDQARRAQTTLARELRNLASPSTDVPRAVDVAQPYDLVFETVDPTKAAGSQNERNIKRVRYCLGDSSGDRATLWMQAQTWTAPSTPAVPSTTSCPSSAWPDLAGTSTNRRAMAEDVVSREKNVPIFTYNSPQTESISSVRSELFVDVNPGKQPLETRLASGVFLRNQNQAPTASFSATDTGTGHRVLLNGSASEDPEGNSLVQYIWSAAGVGEIGRGVVLYWTAPGSVFPRSWNVTLTVRDAGGRDSTYTQTVPVS
jgi:type II secretory pathway pseudopilin PulG